jgi:hypothetical protein
MEVKGVMNKSPNSYLSVPNCKEAHLVDFYWHRENASWIRSTSSYEIFGAEHYQSLETALTNVG